MDHAEDGTTAIDRVLAGRYRIQRWIGAGAMGTVWAAYDEVVHRKVAIKEINFPQGMPEHEMQILTDRTMREARAIGALSHPQVITLFDILMVEGRPAIVMELLDARSLAQAIRESGPLSDGRAATVGVAVAGALLAAHRAGITHRDVKPGNVLLGHDGRIKLTDFGIARTVDDPTVTVTGILLGSPAYIAPEVAQGESATPAADAWGLGAMLFACVEGKPPFDRGGAVPTLVAVVSDPVPDHPHSGRLSPVISGLLTKDPNQRWTVQQALDALRRVADDPSGMHLPDPAPGEAMTHALAGPTPHSTLADRSYVPRAGNAAGTNLPPPPWAASGSDSLAPLPVSSGATAIPVVAAASAMPRAWLYTMAVVVALLAGVGGYFLVQLMSGLS